MTVRQREYIVWLLKVSAIGLTSPFLLQMIKLFNGTLAFSFRELFVNLLISLLGVILLLLGLEASSRF